MERSATPVNCRPDGAMIGAVAILAQGFLSATPRFIPAYDLASLTGLFSRTALLSLLLRWLAAEKREKRTGGPEWVARREIIGILNESQQGFTSSP